MGAILSKATTITQSMIYASATSLAQSLSFSEEEDGWLYPAVERIREVSVTVTVGVIRAAQEARVDREVRIRDMNDDELESWVRARMYDPHRETRNVEKEIKAMVQGMGSLGNTPKGTPIEEKGSILNGNSREKSYL
jgi:malate dehydrogenase (oxaloacetate-decarboxylating)(NADP+)